MRRFRTNNKNNDFIEINTYGARLLYDSILTNKNPIIKK